MTIRMFAAVALAVAIVSPGAGQAAPQTGAGRGELRTAIDLQTVDGNLPAAIKRYQAIVDRYGKTDRATAAEALLRMADCYRALGDAQARAAYERVVREFGDVNAAAGTARAQLAAMNAAPASPGAGAMALRRVYDGPGIDWCNGLSSDARYLTHPDWNTGNIGIVDLRSGKGRNLTATGSLTPATAQAGEFGECTIFSPDDKQVAFYWDSRSATELRVVTLDGRVRTLYAGGPDKPYMRPLDWSRDGRFILAEISRKAGDQLAIVAVADGAARVLKTLGERPGQTDGYFSPNGRYVAYSVAASADSSKREIFVITTDGAREGPAVQDPSDDHLLGWAADGRSLVFASDRTGRYGLWTIGVDDVRAIGVPALVKADIGPITPVRLVNGSLYYAMNTQISEVHVAAVDPATGKITGTSAPAKSHFTGANAKPDWSPDGRYLAYLAYQGTSGFPASPDRISILDLSTGTEKHVRPSLEALEAWGSGPMWSPDGRSLLVIARQQTPQHGVHRVDIDTGATTELVSARGRYLLHAVWSRDGRHIYYTIGGGDCDGAPRCPTRLMRRDVGSGADTELVSLPDPAGVPRIALSRDGRWLAFSARAMGEKPFGYVSVMPASGGTPRRIYTTPEGEGAGVVTWSPDDRHVYFAAPGGLWRVMPDGSGLEAVDQDARGGRARFSFSPDGRRLAFTIGESKSELWVIENLATAKAR